MDVEGYPYVIHPITDGIPSVEPDMLREIIRWMLDVCEFDCDVILTPESMGIPLAVPLSLTTNIPYSVIRKRRYGLPGEIAVESSTGYSRSSLYINGLKKGDRVVIVDDVISTGGTMSSIIERLKENDIEVADILIVFNKGNKRTEFDIPIKRMMHIGVKDNVPFCEPVD